MALTILVLLIAIALFMFGGMLVKHDPKKQPNLQKMLVKKSIKLVALVLLIVGVARIWTPIYLTSTNPGIVMDMVRGAQAAEQEKMTTGIKKHVKKYGDEMMKNAPIIGNKDAKKTIYVFTDYSCGYCRRLNGELENLLKTEKDVRVVLKNLSNHGLLSDAAAKAMVASKVQGCDSEKLNHILMEKNYWPSDLKQDPAKIEKTILKNVLAAAQKAGCDIDKMNADMDGEVVAAELAETRAVSQEFGIQGTPFVIVGDQAFPGAVPESTIREALK
ncbi:MAG: thioredoxin domain-containing protein [Rickettsiales bacterium]|jgi:protein-disulfide isomerase|nr:thioredoxin domain-containing protein [Rickettsiales bacterium]